MQKLAVVYFLNQNLEELNTFRQRYDPKWEMIPLHITIVYPVADILEDQLLEHIENVMNDIKPFSIHLTGLTKSFDHCLFLLVKEGHEKISKLHDKLYSGILQPFIQSDPSFAPHVTIGYFGNENDDLNSELYERAYKEAKKMDINVIANFDKIALIKGDGVTPAKTIKTIKLHS